METSNITNINLSNSVTKNNIFPIKEKAIIIDTVDGSSMKNYVQANGNSFCIPYF